MIPDPQPQPQERWVAAPSDDHENDSWVIRREGETVGASVAKMLWKWDAEHIVDLHNQVAALSAEIAQLRSAISREPDKLGHAGMVALAEAHRQDSEDVDALMDERSTLQQRLRALEEKWQGRRHGAGCQRFCVSCAHAREVLADLASLSASAGGDQP